MARKKRADDGGEGANWMDTYGDLVTLLLTFFVLLFSSSTMDAAKWEALVGAFSGSNVASITVLSPVTAMEPPIETIIQSPTDEDLEIDESQQTPQRLLIMSELEDNLKNYMNDNGLSEGVDITTQEHDMSVTVRFSDSILFDSGSADIRPDGYEVVDHLIEAFVRNIHLIAEIGVEGHTDNVVINTTEFRDNMELSLMRAYSVWSYILDSGRIDPALIKATGYGEYRKIADNDTEEGRQQNRRVTFVLQTVLEIADAD